MRKPVTAETDKLEMCINCHCWQRIENVPSSERYRIGRCLAHPVPVNKGSTEWCGEFDRKGKSGRGTRYWDLVAQVVKKARD